MLRLTLGVCILAATALASQTVEGRVVDSATGKGLPGVYIGLLGAGQVDFTATTDADGHFQIDGVKDGSYTAFFKAANFEMEFDAGSNFAFQINGPAEPIHLRAKMYRVGKISGHVLDGMEKAVPDARILLSQESRDGVMEQILEVSKNGEYGPEKMQPGNWKVSATAPSTLPPPEPHDGKRFGWAQTFYPGVIDSASAVPVTIPSGHELRDVDIKLAAVPAYTIRGTVLDVHGDPASHIPVKLAPDGLFLDPSARENQSKDGAFEFTPVVDGAWSLTATVTKDGVKLIGSARVQVSGRDLENVKLRLAAPFFLQGEIIMEAAEGSPPAKPPALVAESLDDALGGATGNPNSKGEFTIKNLYPGAYRIVSPAIPAPYYLDSIRLGGADALQPSIQILSGDQRLTVTYRHNGGMVHGAVENCAAGQVFLIPRNPALRLDSLIRQVRCGKDGQFEIPAVRPGEYYAFAMAPDSPVEFRRASLFSNPELDQTLINQSATVIVRANETTSADLRAITH